MSQGDGLDLPERLVNQSQIILCFLLASVKSEERFQVLYENLLS